MTKPTIEKKARAKLEIEMWDFEVDERYFTFKYRVTRDGKIVDMDEINDDYENGNTPKQQEKALKENYGIDLVLQRIYS